MERLAGLLPEPLKKVFLLTTGSEAAECCIKLAMTRGQAVGGVEKNIFVSFDGTVKILDFGIAKAANQIEQTRAGEIKGKLSYMSPEQCMGKPLDNRSDIFSMGVVLYEWLTGFKLFTGESDVAILKSITDGRIYRPSYFKADVPEPDAIALRAAAETGLT